ncbi:MAG: M23 family metallopeptidase [Firmicutes bacterium]|nr:M23 family metallopeptidase [Bacillota bacterium]
MIYKVTHENKLPAKPNANKKQNKDLVFTVKSLIGPLIKSSKNHFKYCVKIIHNLMKKVKIGLIELNRTIKLHWVLKKSRVLKSDKNMKEQKKYFTIMLVPHSSDKVKTIRISRVYTKIAVIIIVLLAAFTIYFYLYISSIVGENMALKSSMDKLYALTGQQETLLSEKIEEINALIKEENSSNINISEYIEKFKDIIDNYVSGRINAGLASRSSTASSSSFVKDINELNEILTALNEINKQKDENLIDLTEMEKKLTEYLNSLPTLWPVIGNITSKFGYRLDPITFRRAYHNGIDIAAPYGTSIKASASGKVILSGYYNELGQTVIIDHGNGISTVYGHASKLLVKKGQTVKKGDIIARVGSSGRTTGSHLHFEIHINGEPIDPYKYLSR